MGPQLIRPTPNAAVFTSGNTQCVTILSQMHSWCPSSFLSLLLCVTSLDHVFILLYLIAIFNKKQRAAQMGIMSLFYFCLTRETQLCMFSESYSLSMFSESYSFISHLCFYIIL